MILGSFLEHRVSGRFCRCPIDKSVNADRKRTQEREGEMHRSHDRLRNGGVWVVQVLLAAVFLVAGGGKLITPVDVLTQMFQLPGEFVRVIGFCEVLGAVGLILPWALGIRRELTPLAAAGLVVIMLGATVNTLVHGGGVLALVDVVFGVLAALVVVGRRQALRGLRQAAPQLQPAAL
jgi:hypothetical protein